jgi:hypothetical protein
MVLWPLGGCQKPLHFPAESLPPAAKAAGASGAYDTNGDGQADFFAFADPNGRISGIGYDTSADALPDQVLDLDAIDTAHCRHLVIILDGVGYDLVKQYRDAGGLRMFHPPSRVIATYPTLTDVCLEDALGYVPCRAFEAAYYDRCANKLSGGSWDYMAGRNQPYDRLLQYRANLIWDAIGYLAPWEVFGKEMNDAARVFGRAQGREVLAYFVSSAGMGTRYGAEGQQRCLREVERLVNQVIWQTRGLTKVTLLADHGHSYTPATRIPLEAHLASKGWKLTDTLRSPRDVACIRFGLETFASFATRRPAELAADLTDCRGVGLASYAQGDTVVVLAPLGARAVISRRLGRYKYQALAGDPLKLSAILSSLQADAEGFFGADDLLAATATHEYPAPLERLWRAHFALAENTPDVIVSLKDEFYFGAQSFSGAVKIASTHGSLNRKNSTTFIMSTIGPLPPLMRSRDIPAVMHRLTGRPWPAKE